MAPHLQPRDSAVHEMSLAIPSSSTGSDKPEQVSLRVVERAGEVQIAVRTSDPQLAGALRQHLPDLVSDLSRRGYQAETWQPLAGGGGTSNNIPGAASAAADSGAGQDWSGQAGSRNGGNPAGQQQQQQQRQPQQQDQPSWLDALAGSAARTGKSLYGYTY